jgi:sulfate transport system permease protein
MSGLPGQPNEGRGHSSGPVHAILIGVALLFLALFLLAPLLVVFTEAFRKGLSVYAAAVSDPVALAAVQLTLTVAALVVPINLIFGLSAAWLIARFEFRGRGFLTSLLDLPFSVSPVISGMIFVLLFGAQGYLGHWVSRHELRIIFALPGIVLATLFVTSPLIARELIPLLESQGTDEEEAALTLGARGWQTFLWVSLPKIRWGILYGVILCNARAMGEFGAVSVVSGHVRGLTNTIPLHVEILYNEYQIAAAFGVASLLTLLALGTLVAKGMVEWRAGRRLV